MAQPESDEEREWIRKSQEGDHAAFEALIDRYQRMIDSLTFRMTGSLAEAQDITQETFIQAFRQLAGYRNEAKFSSWLYRIAVNLSLNWKKRRERQEKLLSDWAAEPTEVGVADPRSAQVQAALMQLKPKQRAAIVLTFYDGLSHGEAARALDCSETTISWRIFAAKAKLKKLLKKVQPAENET